jgi:hypothetical protein
MQATESYLNQTPQYFMTIQMFLDMAAEIGNPGLQTWRLTGLANKSERSPESKAVESIEGWIIDDGFFPPTCICTIAGKLLRASWDRPGDSGDTYNFDSSSTVPRHAIEPADWRFDRTKLNRALRLLCLQLDIEPPP